MRELSRHVSFDACFNFRDLGGYETADGRRVRWSTLYRADTLHRLTSADAAVLRALGLRTVIDLRSGAEIDDHGRLRPGVAEATWQHVPMLDNIKLVARPASELPAILSERARPGEGYLRIVETFATAVTDVVALLADRCTLPAVFHCTAGKDRTGIVAALVLDVLGVPDEEIAADYALTEEARDRSTAWIEANEPDYAAYLAQIPLERRMATPDKILDFLDGLREKFGTVAGFLAEQGVREEQ